MILISPLNQNSVYKLDRLITNQYFIRDFIFGTWNLVNNNFNNNNKASLIINSNDISACNNTTNFNYSIKNNKEINITLRDKINCEK